MPRVTFGRVLKWTAETGQFPILGVVNKFSCVYVAECLDDFGNTYIKVGKANNPQARLANLQVGCPHAISRVSYFRLDSERLALVAEKRIHAALSRHKLRGEWFVVHAGDEDARLAVDATPAEVVSSVLKRPAITRSIDFGVRQMLSKRYLSLLPHAND